MGTNQFSTVASFHYLKNVKKIQRNEIRSILTCTPRMPNMIKNVAAISTMFPIGFREEISVSTTILRPGALLITLKKNIGKKEKAFYGELSWTIYFVTKNEPNKLRLGWHRTSMYSLIDIQTYCSKTDCVSDSSFKWWRISIRKKINQTGKRLTRSAVAYLPQWSQCSERSKYS